MKKELSDGVIARLRTVVPILWASLVAWIITVVAVPDAVVDYLSHPITVAFVVAGATALWHRAWQWVSPRVPDWAVRVFMGSAKMPTYAPVPLLTTSQGESTVSDEGDGVTDPAELVAEPTPAP
jgi:hypothetical protein